MGDLQSMMGGVCAASEPLIEQLEPVAANWIKLELRDLAGDVLLLDRATSRMKEKLKVMKSLAAALLERPTRPFVPLRLQEEREQQELFHTRLEDTEQQIRKMRTNPEARLTNFSKVGHTSDSAGLA